ncbi:MAG: carbon storage regulator [Gammaproteobacteria bacterium]|nr:carbon storage regulator [Gammaproteobacteria bacterium]
MLSLSRKEGESIYIGEDVKMTVHRIDRNQVRLSFVAPRNVTIDREEVFRARKKSD